MLRIAMIGCGAHAQAAHGPPLARLGLERRAAIELVSVCDLDLERARKFCATFGFARAYTNDAEMIAREKPDACVAVMPVPKIAEMAERLLLIGMPCLIEKPMGANIHEVRYLTEVAARKGTAHMVSMNRRFLPHLNRAKAWAEAIGPPRFVSATMLRVRRNDPDFIWGTGMHVVDGVRHLVGELTDFQCQSTGALPRMQVWHSARFRFAGGGMGTLHVLPTGGTSDEIYEIMGEGYRAQVSAKQSGITTLRCWRDEKLEVEELGLPEAGFVQRGEYAEVVEFVDALLEKRRPRPGLVEVLASAELCARIMSSAQPDSDAA